MSTVLLSVDRPRPAKQRSLSAAERISQAQTVFTSISHVSPSHRRSNFYRGGDGTLQRSCSALTTARPPSSTISLRSENFLRDRHRSGTDDDEEEDHQNLLQRRSRSYLSLSGLKRAESFADQLVSDLAGTSLFSETNVGLVIPDNGTETSSRMNGCVDDNEKRTSSPTVALSDERDGISPSSEEGEERTEPKEERCRSADTLLSTSDHDSQKRQPVCSDRSTPALSASPVLSPEKDGMMFEYFGLEVVDRPERPLSTPLAPAECHTGLLSFRRPMCVGGSGSVSPAFNSTAPLAPLDKGDVHSSAATTTATGQTPSFVRPRKEVHRKSSSSDMPADVKRKSAIGRIIDRMSSFRTAKRESSMFVLPADNEEPAVENQEVKQPAPSLEYGGLIECASCPSLTKAGRSETPPPDPHPVTKRKRNKSFREKLRMKSKRSTTDFSSNTLKAQRRPASDAALLHLTKPRSRSEQDLTAMEGEETRTVSNGRSENGLSFRQANGALPGHEQRRQLTDRSRRSPSEAGDHGGETVSGRDEQSQAGRYVVGEATTPAHNSVGTVSTATSVFSSVVTDDLNHLTTKVQGSSAAEGTVSGADTLSAAASLDGPLQKTSDIGNHRVVVRPRHNRHVPVETREIRTRSVEGLVPSFMPRADRSALTDLSHCASLERLAGPLLSSDNHWESSGRDRSASDHRSGRPAAGRRRRSFRRAESTLSHLTFDERIRSLSLNNLRAWTNKRSKASTSTSRGSLGDVNWPGSPPSRRSDGGFIPGGVRSVVALGRATSMESVGAGSTDSSRLATSRFGGSLSMSEQMVDTISERDVTPPPGHSDFHPPIKSKVDLTPEDMRQHVVQTLLESEHKYVMSLRVLEKDYLDTLKARENGLLVDAAVADEIFYKIPVVNLCHKAFYKHLCEKVEKWHAEQTFGDVFLQSFSKGILSETYTAFINHYMQSRDAVGMALAQRPGFAKFLEQVCRDSGDKLTLNDLLIMPVQRIPRYVLIIKDLLKHTPQTHPDHALLLQALGEMISLAEKMNRGEQYANQLELLRELEYCFDGAITGLVAPHRHLIRRDRVTEEVGSQQKDRMLILISDMVFCATVRRRTSNRKAHPLWLSALSSDMNVKYKLIWRAPLRELRVDACASDNKSFDKQISTVSHTEKDLITLSQISLLSEQLRIPHQDLYHCIDGLVRVLNDQMHEKNSIRRQSVAVLCHESQRGVPVQHCITFQSIEDKNSWIGDFSEAKEKHTQPTEGSSAWWLDPGAVVSLTVRIPTFLNYISAPVMKTRAGMQITCASSTVGAGNLTPAAIKCKANGQLWVCHSDGHVGQVCMVNTDRLPPRLTACITVCDARITCILAVPEYIPPSISDFIARNKNSDSDDDYDGDSETDSDSDDTLAEEDDAPLPTGSISNDNADSSASYGKGVSTTDGAHLRNLSMRPARGKMPSVVFEGNEEVGSCHTSSALEKRRPTATSINSLFSPMEGKSVESLFSSVMKQLESKLLLVKAALNLTPLSHTKTQEGKRSLPEQQESLQSVKESAVLEGHKGEKMKGSIPSQNFPVEQTAVSEAKTEEETAARAKPIGKHPSTRSLNDNLRWHPSPSRSLSKRKEARRDRRSLSSSSMGELIEEKDPPEDIQDLLQCMVDVVVAAEKINAEQTPRHNQRDVVLKLWRKEISKQNHLLKSSGQASDDNCHSLVASSPLTRESSACSDILSRHPQPATFASTGHRANGEATSVCSNAVDDSEGSDVVSRSDIFSRSDSDVSTTSSRFRRLRRNDSVGWQSTSSSFDNSDGRVKRGKSPGNDQRVSRPAPHAVVRQTSNVTLSGFGDDTKTDHNPTMWMGTDNGQLYIYRAGDSIRMRQRRSALNFKSAIVCMCNTENHVFIAFQDGCLLMFSRTAAGDWDIQVPDEIMVGQPQDIINCMVAVRKEPWCACRNTVSIVSPLSLEVKKSFRVAPNPSGKVGCMVSSGLGVYIALEGSTIIQVYHALTQEHLVDIDILPSVREILAGCDAIIRQHKIPRLRLTTLQSFRNLIWAGTSAGVVLSIPATLGIQRSTSAANIGQPPQPQASYHGHTGPVHFISCIDRESKHTAKGVGKTDDDVQFRERSGSRSHRHQVTLSESVSSSSLRSSAGQSVDLSAMEADSAQYMPVANTQGLVISGGDGYEDFKASALNLPDEDYNHDDTSSHFLMWEAY